MFEGTRWPTPFHDGNNSKRSLEACQSIYTDCSTGTFANVYYCIVNEVCDIPRYENTIWYKQRCEDMFILDSRIRSSYASKTSVHSFFCLCLPAGRGNGCPCICQILSVSLSYTYKSEYNLQLVSSKQTKDSKYIG